MARMRISVYIVLLLFCIAMGCAQPKEPSVIRQPAVADQFYPGDPKELAALIDRMLADAPAAPVTGRLVGIQVPHAGYPYSGPTAARAFKLLAGLDSVTVVLLGPSHRVMLDRAAVFTAGKWHTPLGDVEVDAGLARAIVAQDEFLADWPQAHAQEHSLEVQVPFLQRVLTNFKIVPIMMLEPEFGQCERVGKAIARAAQGKHVLLLASSDLYHGYSYTDAKRADSLTTGMIVKFEPESLAAAFETGEAQACGSAPVVAMMVAARELGANRSVLLWKTNSNDMTGEKGGYCVGYSAVAFLASGEGASPDELTAEEQRSLVQIARTTLDSYIKTGKAPEPAAATARLAEKRGAFVTLHEQGELRGCIGYIEAVQPVYRAVRDMAISASTEDPRFPPVGPAELKDIDIEITVLSLLRRISDPESVVVGKHGLVMRQGGRSGLLLPQVPVEQGWDRRQFLEYTCLKAGLATDAWQDKRTEMYVFTGQVFGEKSLGLR